MKTWFNIKAAAEGTDFAEVSILDEIGFWGVSAKDFLAQFKAIAAPKVKLYINSPGGSVFEAIAMFNGMRASGKEIEVHVLGIAASAASYIAMAGDKVVMPENTMMFLHNPINAVYGNAADMRDMADILDKIGSSLTATYAKRFKGEASVLDQLMADEAYLTAAECLEYGFCDEVTPEITATALFDVERLPENVQALFQARQPDPVVEPEPDPVPAVVAVAPLADEIAALAATNDLGAFTAHFVTVADTIEAATTLIKAASEIKALAKHAGMPDSAEALIRGSKTVAEARGALQAALAEADAASAVDTAARATTLQPASKDADWNPTALWADIRAMKAGSKK